MKYTIPVALLVSACSFTRPDPLPPVAPKERPIRIDERLLVECATLSPLKDNPKPSEVLLQHGADVKAYQECANGKLQLIKEIRAMSGTENANTVSDKVTQ